MPEPQITLAASDPLAERVVRIYAELKEFWLMQRHAFGRITTDRFQQDLNEIQDLRRLAGQMYEWRMTKQTDQPSLELERKENFDDVLQDLRRSNRST